MQGNLTVSAKEYKGMLLAPLILQRLLEAKSVALRHRIVSNH